MDVESWLRMAEHKLAQAGIGTARLDALVLLEDVSQHDRAWLLARPDHNLSPAVQVQLEKVLNERARHVPLAYVRKKTEFYGREFVVTPAVLEPRSESETMIDLLKRLPLRGGLRPKASPGRRVSPPILRIADVGTGSGALGITAFLELRDRENVAVDLLEIDQGALKVAKTNVDKYTIPAPVIRSDLLSRSTGNYDVLLCNLPYVPDDHTVNRAALHEPQLAIFGGPDGLNLYRKLFQQIAGISAKPLYILTESLPPQHDALRRIAEVGGYRLEDSEDFIQLFSWMA